VWFVLFVLVLVVVGLLGRRRVRGGAGIRRSVDG
jgi:hypothetical protein